MVIALTPDLRSQRMGHDQAITDGGRIVSGRGVVTRIQQDVDLQ